MHRIVVDVQTGQVTQVELTAEEIAAIDAAQTPVEAPVEPTVEAPVEPTVEAPVEPTVETPAEPTAEQ